MPSVLELLVATVLVLIYQQRHVSATSCMGCVELDELNFDQTVLRFPYALIKFDIAFPYGEKHEAFAQFSKASHKVTDELLVGTVGIKDYGEMENKQLGLRFKVDDKSFPAIFLYRGSLSDFVKFPAHLEVTLDNLKTFVTEHTKLFIGRDGCIKEYEELVQGYANLEELEQQQRMQQAEALKKTLNAEAALNSAKCYLTFMRKILEKGYDFVEEETKRLQRLKASKVSDAKKTELTERLNILESFRVNKLTKREANDEL